jgi:hypothetical protein
MDLIIYGCTLLVGFGLSLFWKPDYIWVDTLARLYMGLVLLGAVSVWVYYFAGIKNPTVLQIMGQTLKWVASAAHLILGYLLGRFALDRDAASRTALNITLLALSISVGNTFLVATVGKSANMDYMITFFKQSGYAIWFLYFIMIAETAGAIGVLTHFRLKMGIFAAVGLALIMVGAVYTHWHNGDPFSDSYSAVSVLISLSLLGCLYFLEWKKTEVA